VHFLLLGLKPLPRPNGFTTFDLKKRVEVRLENTNICFAPEAFDRLAELMRKAGLGRVFVLTDENTKAHCWPHFQKRLPDDVPCRHLHVPSGESHKSPEALLSLWRELHLHAGDRSSLFINLGGGVISDLGGFTAATYMRGISFVNFPTTLLAMVDASLGSKTALNLDGIKNLVGAFASPLLVGIDPKFLFTLSRDELLSGLAEMFKHGLIADRSHFEALQELPFDNPVPGLELILQSLRIKHKIVAQDPREAGPRKLLNFGHTVGHALEAHSHESGAALRHGYAVGLGMRVELALSVACTGLPKNEARSLDQNLARWYPWPSHDWDLRRLQDLMSRDKKNRAGQWLFTLISSPGHAVYNVPVPPESVRHALEKCFAGEVD